MVSQKAYCQQPFGQLQRWLISCLYHRAIFDQRKRKSHTC
ncbi:hypothetical protein D931_00461 [Enterococcus faecium 13.SD.W.09]|nr:hypothetical protein D931_00461 [Enterococcus faecium 13.SD.W.09]